MIHALLHKKRTLWIIVFGLLSFIFVISTFSAYNKGITYDEIAHIGSGYSYLTEHDYRLNPEHPPILKVISALPLLWLNPTFDVHDKNWWQSGNDVGEFNQWDAGRYLLHEAGNDTDKVMFVARMPFVILATLFGLFLFTWGRRLGGSTVGILTLIFYTGDPNILAHNHLITTDIGAALSIMVMLFFYIRFLHTPTWLNTMLAGIFFALANTVKFSALILIPFLFIITIFYIFLQHRDSFGAYMRDVGHYFVRGFAIMMITLTTIYIIYVPLSYKTPPTVLEHITPIKIHGDEPKNIATRETILTMNKSDIIRPFTLYVHGVSQVFYRVAGGNHTYFLGTVSSNANPIYFPLVFLIKEPIILLFLYILIGAIGILFLMRGLCTVAQLKFIQSLRIFQGFFRVHFTELVLILFIVFYTYIAITSNLTIGLRHLFPIFPPLYLLTATVLARAYRKIQSPHHKRIASGTLFIMTATLLISTLRAYPTYIGYFNALVGGSDHGWEIVVDSNADWGQASKHLLTYIEAHPEIDVIRVDYFGGDNITQRLGDKMIPWWDSKRPVEPGFYAISATLLQDSNYSNKSYDNSYRWTRQLTPYDVIDGSIIIYKVN